MPEPKPSEVIVVETDGQTLRLEALEGWRLMEILRDYKMGVEGLCGGACACGTCHIEVAPEWIERLHPPRDEELDQLDEVPNASDASRLSCQIIWSDALDGLTIRIPEA